MCCSSLNYMGDGLYSFPFQNAKSQKLLFGGKKRSHARPGTCFVAHSPFSISDIMYEAFYPRDPLENERLCAMIDAKGPIIKGSALFQMGPSARTRDQPSKTSLSSLSCLFQTSGVDR